MEKRAKKDEIMTIERNLRDKRRRDSATRTENARKTYYK